jgi:hypothetical protein
MTQALLESGDKVFLVIRERFMKIVVLSTRKSHLPRVLYNDVAGH